MTGTFAVLQGNVQSVLKTVESESVHCVVTSPPYWGLRDYGADGQIGLEETPEKYVAKLVDVFGEVRRVLRPDGTLWLNLGDSYAGSWEAQSRPGGNDIKNGLLGKSMLSARQIKAHPKGQTHTGSLKNTPGLKPKDLVGIPWMVAFALRADGWYLRSDIIWSKNNPMPESVTDRPTKSHEYLFLLSKSQRYFYDAPAIAEPAQTWTGQAATFERSGPVSEHVIPGQSAAQHRPNRNGKNSLRGQGANRDTAKGASNRDGRDMQEVGNGQTRNRHSVWTIATQPFAEAHFATFPLKLVEPCVMAGTSEKGVCGDCSAPWIRLTERTSMVVRPGPTRDAAHAAGSGSGRRDTRGTMLLDPPTSRTIGWQRTCEHLSNPIASTVLDPFAGSGTVGVVALRLGRNFVGIELNPKYVNMAKNRIRNDAPLLNQELTT